MPLDPGALFSRDIENTRVRDNQRIRLKLVELAQIQTDALQIIIVCQNIHRHMYTNSVAVRVTDSFRHILVIEIFCLGPKPIDISTDINRIRAKSNRYLQHFETARRDQKLRLSVCKHK